MTSTIAVLAIAGICFIILWCCCSIACCWTKNEKPLTIASSITMWITLLSAIAYVVRTLKG